MNPPLDPPQRPAGESVFQTPWFEIVATPVPGSAAPFYVIHCTNFVALAALNEQGELLLVRQYRPGAGAVTLEVPGGHVEAGETPEQAARKELLEETGHEAGPLELLAVISPSNARFTNRMWCYFAPDSRPAAHAAAQREAGVELVRYRGGVRALTADPEFSSAGSWALLLAALRAGKVAW
jgi:8-oxo-dGTP pyrophosphatase MutT (NUDIX family)